MNDETCPTKRYISTHNRTNVRLIMQCDKRLTPKAKYVFATFTKTLGLLLVDAADTSDSFDGVTVWYGHAGSDWPQQENWVTITAAHEAAEHFAGKEPLDVDSVRWVTWRQYRLPVLFWDESRASVDVSSKGHISFDIIASAFYFLSCWEETVIDERDTHGRFLFRQSLAAQLDSQANIVDQYLDIFLTLLNDAGCNQAIPAWPDGASFVVCLTHDVDEIRKTRLSRLKFAWNHTLRPAPAHRHTPTLERVQFALDTLVSPRDPYWTFPTFLDVERTRGFTATYFFQAGTRADGTRYDLSEPRVRDFIDNLQAYGFEVGLHGSYHASLDEQRFRREQARLNTMLDGQPMIGHRNHYLRMEYTRSLPIYERAGIHYDATLGYADQPAYRNSFSYPFHPYNHTDNCPFSFWELPTVIMDVTLAGYQHLSAASAWECIRKQLEYAHSRQGCITVLWHNIWEGVYPGYFDLYPKILAWTDRHGGLGLAGRDVIARWCSR